MLMNKKYYITGVLLIVAVLIFLGYSMRTQAISKDELLTPDKSEINSITFLKSIYNVEDTYTGKSKFTNVDKIKFNSINIKDKKNWSHKSIILENDEILIETNDISEPITYINKNLLNTIKKKDFKKISMDIMEASAEKLSRIIGGENLMFQSSKEGMNGYAEFRWNRTYSGYIFNTDFLLIVVDEETGEIVNISNRLLSNNPAINVKFSEADATIAATKYLKTKYSFSFDKPLSVEKKIVNPNNYWKVDDPLLVYTTATRLAYEVKYKKNETQDGIAVIWIDCENGEVLGGYQSK